MEKWRKIIESYPSINQSSNQPNQINQPNQSINQNETWWCIGRFSDCVFFYRSLWTTKPHWTKCFKGIWNRKSNLISSKSDNPKIFQILHQRGFFLSSFLAQCRPLSVSMGNAIRHFKWLISHTPVDMPDSEVQKNQISSSALKIKESFIGFKILRLIDGWIDWWIDWLIDWFKPVGWFTIPRFRWRNVLIFGRLKRN